MIRTHFRSGGEVVEIDASNKGSLLQAEKKLQNMLMAAFNNHKNSFERIIGDVVGEMTAELILRTPVDTGRARKGWKITLRRPSKYVPPKQVTKKKKYRRVRNRNNTYSLVETGEVVEKQKRRGMRDREAKKMAQAARDRGKDLVGKYIPAEKAYITNNVPYILKLEYGSSAMAREGFVTPTLIKGRKIIEREFKRVARKRIKV